MNGETSIPKSILCLLSEGRKRKRKISSRKFLLESKQARSLILEVVGNNVSLNHSLNTINDRGWLQL
jgi:hypothetical protein